MATVLAWMIRDAPHASWGIHELGPQSAAAFETKTPIPAPTKEEPERAVAPPHARFEVALCTLVAHHVSDLETFFTGVRDVLKPGGTFVVVEFAHGDDGEDLSVKAHLTLKPDMEAVDDESKVSLSTHVKLTNSLSPACSSAPHGPPKAC
jgi:SAM-dependent methyltransferase